MNLLHRLIIEQFRGWRTVEVAWLVFCLSAIIALSVHWGDTAVGIAAAATGMMYTVLAGKGKCSCFIFGLVNTPLYAHIAFKAGYYGDFALNIYYFLMMFPALAAWLRNQSNDSEESTMRTRLPSKWRIALGLSCLAGTLALWALLHFIGGSRPLCDAITNVLSVAAMILTVRRAIEEWILWIIVDAVEVFMWWKSWYAGNGSISVLLMWLLFLANGIYLLSLWLRVAKKHGSQQSGQPEACSDSGRQPQFA